MKIHKLHLLRAKLLHFVNCLSYYLLTRVSVWLVDCGKLITTEPFSSLDSSQFRTGVLSADGRGVQYDTFFLPMLIPPQAQHLDAIIELHRDYVFAVHNRCLLHKNVSVFITDWCEWKLIINRLDMSWKPSPKYWHSLLPFIRNGHWV